MGRSQIKFSVLLFASLLIAGLGACKQDSKTHKISSSELLNWELVGIGTKAFDPDEKALKLTEGKDSKGVVLLSTENLAENLTLKFKVKPLQYEGVCVIILSASKMDGDPMVIPADHDGTFEFWKSDTTDIQSYTIAFHTSYHQPNAFITKNPGFTDLARATDLAREQIWYEIEIGKAGDQLWVKVDDQLVLSATDHDAPLPGGKLGLRLRGPGDGTFSCLFKDLIHTPTAPLAKASK